MRIPNGPLYGLVSVLPTQGLRLNFSNSATSGSCTANVALVDQAGATFATASAIVLGGTESNDKIITTPTDFTAVGGTLCIDGCPGGIPNLPAAGADGRARFRPSISLSGPAGVPIAAACGHITVGLEVIDPSGRTDVLFPDGPTHPASPLLAALLNIFPEGPVFPFAGTVAGDVAQVSLANTNTNAAGPACPAKFSFVDSAGTTLASQSITLAPGASAVLTQAGGIPAGVPPPGPGCSPTQIGCTTGGTTSGVLALRPVVSFLAPNPILPISPFLPFRAVNLVNPCRGVVATAEVFDAASAKTRFFYPSDPIRLRLGF